MNEPESALVLRWQEGNADAAAELARRYAPAAGAVAYGILRDAALCEDVVQETFARATKSIRKLRSEERVGPFLVGIARHIALDMARTRSRSVSLGEDGWVARRDPAKDAARGELRARLREAVAKLPDDQRELFLMKYVSGMRYDEIARTVGITSDAVGQKLWRIRRKLQRELEDFRP